MIKAMSRVLQWRSASNRSLKLSRQKQKVVASCSIPKGYKASLSRSPMSPWALLERGSCECSKPCLFPTHLQGFRQISSFFSTMHNVYRHSFPHITLGWTLGYCTVPTIIHILGVSNDWMWTGLNRLNLIALRNPHIMNSIWPNLHILGL